MEDMMKDRVEQLVDYIMKNCLWQFHSRAWDREKQNEGILTKTMQILCEEPVEKETPMDKVYWVDAVCLADAFKKRYSWLAALDKDEIKLLMQGLKERMDYLTITGSLNAELTDPHY
ncbi:MULTISPECIES: Fe-only nitrogenase subunit delta [Pelosinus]|jgi:nitrogenase delta subunit|uniref:Nitrogenase iron-iron protein delta chain n=1 Tax=Pelosinus fermentans B4 TaxID=1149862 RepID=I8RMH0_9FIRM|nr:MULTISPECIES: Fe-only nitrogenase subunit delta [Pelosinus]EIW20045.1 Fe-only nitrogenase, delta subunit [Pelosinus fermentans B4]EIW26100.1 Fe-only nitrogenase, delta subunit [Pelosinus fermentans A11]OAM93149.1 Fe-only nitrogenase, delta subunit [Pelosinus fermentans DSM 17108]SDQ68563.1 Fe-only nitrogenase FeFe protein subunit AnfG [Pelosinus fermentans]